MRRKTMKKNIFILFILGIVCNDAVAQKKLLQKPFHSQQNKAAIASFLQEINDRAGIVLEYSSGSFNAGKIVSLEGNENTIGDVLQTILKGQHVKLLEHNGKMMIVPSPDLFSIANYLPAHFSLYGYIKENATKEPLVSATIYEPSTQRGVLSNNQGYYNFFLSEGKHTIEVSYGGLQSVQLDLEVHGNMRRDITLVMKGDTLSAVVVQSDASMKEGAIKVSGEHYFSNGLMNEDDPLQYLYLSPGLQNSSYSFSGFQVRGGGTDENLFLLDGNPVYNPTHLLGAISILNPTVLKSMRFYSSDFPARLGGSLSSVLDVHTKQGNMSNWQGEINAGMLAGSLTLEGPLIKDKVAIMISGRKHIPMPFIQSLQDGVSSDFYDAHFRLSAILSPRNKLAANFYRGEDQLRHSGKYVGNLNKWGNTIGSLSWNAILGRRSFVNTSVNFSHYQNLEVFQYTLFELDSEAEADDEDEPETEEDTELEEKYVGTFSSLKNYNVHSQAEIYASDRLKFNAGFKLAQTTIKPFDSKITDILEDAEDNFVSFTPLVFEDLSGYAEAEIKAGRKLFLKPGLRVSGYQLEGYHTVVFQPRFFVSYSVHPRHKLYASFSKMNQFLHLVTNPYAGANRDLWVPSTKILKPESSEIYNFGYAYQLQRKWRVSVDGYYKQLMNVTNYAQGKSSFINSTDWEQNIELGKGRSYGAELMIRNSGEKFSWQVSYALSWSWRQFASINGGKEFPYKYDHRHAANAGFTWAVSPRWDISGLWSFATGNVYSLGGLVFADTLATVPDDPINDYQFTYQYNENDQYRAKAYQRFDVALTWHSLKGKKFYSSLKAGVYNINGSDGQYSYNLRGAMSSKSIRIRTGERVFDLIPYVSLTVKF